MPKRLVMLGPRERLPLGEVEAARDLPSTAGTVSSDGWGGHEGIRSRAFCIKLSFAFIKNRHLSIETDFQDMCFSQ